MFKLDNLSINVLDKSIIKNMNLEINPGEVHVIMGLNGAGKSTICKAILNDETYTKTSGKIIFNDNDITNMDTSLISRLGIFLLGQNPIAIEGVTNLELIRTSLNERYGKQDIFKLKKDIENACEIINLDKSFINRYVNDGMSGGEKKKNELLHMFMLEPSLILLDELDSGLDVDALKDVCTAINKYISDKNPGVLIITHHTNILNYIKPDYVHILSDGHIIKTGDSRLAEEIENNGFNMINEVVNEN